MVSVWNKGSRKKTLFHLYTFLYTPDKNRLPFALHQVNIKNPERQRVFRGVFGESFSIPWLYATNKATLFAVAWLSNCFFHCLSIVRHDTFYSFLFHLFDEKQVLFYILVFVSDCVVCICTCSSALAFHFGLFNT